MFDPSSPQAQAITNLFILTLAIAAVIFMIVAGGVVYMMIRFRARPGAGEPYQQFGIKKLEIVWTAIPALILIVLFGFTVSTMTNIQAGLPSSNSTPDLEVVGHQWWWEYRYPKSGAVTANEAHIPVGQKWLVQVKSADVIHSFWVPQLGRKMDAIPGKPDNYIFLQADEPGLYQGTCSEYCGTEHAWMRIRVYADAPTDFNAWIKEQVRIPPTPTTGKAGEGAKLFQEKACAVCHTIRGTAAQGTAGPDLTHVATRDTLATGVVSNSYGSLAAWIENPQGLKPGNHMPSLKLTPEELDALVAYLEALQ
jgi:cytochrome c oxidase subunit 2